MPENSFVPDFVTALMSPPVNPLARTSYGATSTLNSSIASIEIGCVPAWPPGVPEPASPNTSFSVAPSTWMLLYRLFRPPSDVEPPPDESGLSRAKSASDRLMVGSASISSSDTFVAFPVRLWAITAPAPSAVTTTSPISAVCSPSAKLTVSIWPSVRVSPSRTDGTNPTNEAVIVYGPPTRRPRRSYRPSARLVVPNWDPDGSWTATTVAPGSGSPASSRTTPETAAVVLPWAAAGPLAERAIRAARAAGRRRAVRMSGPWGDVGVGPGAAWPAPDGGEPRPTAQAAA